MEKALRKKIYDYFKVEFADELRSKINQGYELDDFNINPFNLVALASGVFGKATSKNMAKALVYPRALGTSITTQFGDKMQKLCVNFLGAQPSAAPGMDFSYTDKVSGENIFMQLKAGPNTINKDDIEPILEKMKSAYRLLQQNRIGSSMPIFALGVTYGSITDISYHYKKIQGSSIGAQPNVPIFIGQDFWHRLTGENDFYISLIKVFVELFENENYSDMLDTAVKNLAQEIESQYCTNGEFDPAKI